MLKLLLISAALGTLPAAAIAQTAPAQPQPPAAEQAQKPKTVTKVVCEDIPEERSTGSRLRSTTKICRKVVVPVDAANQNQGSQPSNAR